MISLVSRVKVGNAATECRAAWKLVMCTIAKVSSARVDLLYPEVCTAIQVSVFLVSHSQSYSLK